MGKKEDPIIWYYNQKKNFAELLNGWLFQGKKRITPQQVHAGNIRYTKRTGVHQKAEYRALYRDIVKKVEDVQVRVIVGTEIQTYIDYSMPIRVMNYDVSDYKRQLEQIIQGYRAANPAAVRLSPIEKKDHLIPTITLVLYLGEKPWDGANSLYDILDLSNVPAEMKAYIADYPIYVLDVCHTEDERLLEFPKDIACMFLFMKYQKDKKKLLEIFDSMDEFQSVSSDTYEVVWKYTNEQWFLEKKEQLEEKEGEVNMCQAIRELVAESEENGANKATERINKLVLLLMSEKRYEDLEKAASDRLYQNQLFETYGI